MTEQALTTTNTSETALTTWDDSGFFDPEENMKCVQSFSLQKVEILHSAGLYQFENGDSVKSFDAFIVEWHRANSFWMKKKDDGAISAERPDCFSLDGVKPSENSKHKQSDVCASCTQNKFGKNSEPKKCQNKYRLYTWNDEELLPKVLNVPATSIAVVDKFLLDLASSKKPARAVKVTFTLKREEKGSNKYSTLIMTEKEVITRTDPRIQVISQLVPKTREYIANQDRQHGALNAAEQESSSPPDNDIPPPSDADAPAEAKSTRRPSVQQKRTTVAPF